MGGGKRYTFVFTLSLYCSNQVLANGRGVLDCLGVTKRGAEIEKG